MNTMTPRKSIPEHSQRVLFVDDDDLVCRAFKRDIEKHEEFVVTVARSGKEGLAALNGHPFGVVISDYHIPGMDGIDFLERVRAEYPESVRILASGKADLDTVIEVINRVGLYNFVLKPWNSRELGSLVRRAMKHYRLSVENRQLTAQLAEKVGELGELNSSLESEVQRRTTSLLLGLINALDLRDTETQSHSRRVALYARRLAEELNIGGAELHDIERGALLHDVGKIGVSDTILLKPGKLTEEEWEEMRKHSMHGYRILQGIEFLGQARRVVLEHHERWDGKGYPQGLDGESICIGARIFAVIDTYDAMTSDRPYRKALPHKVAEEEIQKMSGSQFDPEVVEAWCAIPLHDLLDMRSKAEGSNGFINTL